MSVRFERRPSSEEPSNKMPSSMSRALAPKTSFKEDLMSKIKPKIQRTKSLVRSGSFNEQCQTNVRKTELENLSEKSKKVYKALRYLHDIVTKEILEQLAAGVNILLEVIMELDQFYSGVVRDDNSTLLSSSYAAVNQSVAELFRWADQIVMNGCLDVVVVDKQLAINLIKTVEDSIQRLILLAEEKMKNKNNISSIATATVIVSPTTVVVTAVTGEATPLIESVNSITDKNVIGLAHQYKDTPISAPPSLRSPPGIPTPSLLRSPHPSPRQTSPRVLSYSADNLLDDSRYEEELEATLEVAPPPKPPLPRNLTLHSYSLIGRSQEDIDTDLPPPLPLKTTRHSFSAGYSSTTTTTPESSGFCHHTGHSSTDTPPTFLTPSYLSPHSSISPHSLSSRPSLSPSRYTHHHPHQSSASSVSSTFSSSSMDDILRDEGAPPKPPRPASMRPPLETRISQYDNVDETGGPALDSTATCRSSSEWNGAVRRSGLSEWNGVAAEESDSLYTSQFQADLTNRLKDMMLWFETSARRLPPAPPPLPPLLPLPPLPPLKSFASFDSSFPFGTDFQRSAGFPPSIFAPPPHIDMSCEQQQQQQYSACHPALSRQHMVYHHGSAPFMTSSTVTRGGRGGGVIGDISGAGTIFNEQGVVSSSCSYSTSSSGVSSTMDTIGGYTQGGEVGWWGPPAFGSLGADPAYYSMGGEIDQASTSLPPPLPPKTRNVNTYMQMFGRDIQPRLDQFSRHSVSFLQTQWAEHQLSMHPNINRIPIGRAALGHASHVQPTNRNSDVSSVHSSGSSNDDAPLTLTPPTQTADQSSSSVTPPPALPPKLSQGSSILSSQSSCSPSPLTAPPTPPVPLRHGGSRLNPDNTIILRGNRETDQRSDHESVKDSSLTPVQGSVSVGGNYHDSTASSASCPVGVRSTSSRFMGGPSKPAYPTTSSHTSVTAVSDLDLAAPHGSVGDVGMLSQDMGGACADVGGACGDVSGACRDVGGVNNDEEILTALDQLDVSDQLIYKKPGEEGPELRGGSVDALIVHATAAAKQGQSAVLLIYQEAFLTTYRTFISPSELVTKLLYRYNRFSKSTDPKKRKLSRNAFSMLIRVVDELCTETDEHILETLLKLVHELLRDGELMLARTMRTKVLEKCEKHRLKHDNSQRAPLLSAISITLKSYNITKFKAEDIAKQMTRLDAELFQKIETPEVLLWSREQSEEHSPNLTRFTEHFNKMSYWCRTRILERDDPKEREKYLMKFIKVMKHLRLLNNFNSYLAILSAVDSAPVRRLEWQKQNVEALKEYCKLIDSSSSFRAYREALAETEPPCIPYIGLVLQDLTFVHIGNRDKCPDGRVNFAKCWQQFYILENTRRFKQCNYGFAKDDKIVGFFNNFDDCLTEEALWQISESLKPRGGGGGGGGAK